MSKRTIFIFLLSVLTFFIFVQKSSASTILAVVNVDKQQMVVSRNGEELYRWKVSTARQGYETPPGTFSPTRMHKMWYSRQYNNSPMPYAVFYDQGYAIHGTSAVKSLGKPASHGCVRLQTDNAKKFFNLVKEVGSANTAIVVHW